MVKRVVISRSALAAIRAHVAETPDREVCGLLTGASDRVDAAWRTENVAADPSRRFEMDPKSLIAALRAERNGGPAVAGYYHSHPDGVAEPSAADLAQAAPDGRLWIIVTADTLGCWRATAGGFEPVEIVAVPLAR